MFFGIKNLKSYSLLIFLIIIFFVLCLSSSAEKTNVEKNPLVLTGYRMIDELNEEGLRSTEIELFFSKNVVNMMVNENNKKCFSLTNKDDDKILIEIQMADDQIEREKRHIIKIVVQKPLEPATAYKIIISPELESKNGIKLEKQLVMEFFTLGVIE